MTARAPCPMSAKLSRAAPHYRLSPYQSTRVSAAAAWTTFRFCATQIWNASLHPVPPTCMRVHCSCQHCTRSRLGISHMRRSGRPCSPPPHHVYANTLPAAGNISPLLCRSGRPCSPPPCLTKCWSKPSHPPHLWAASARRAPSLLPKNVPYTFDNLGRLVCVRVFPVPQTQIHTPLNPASREQDDLEKWLAKEPPLGRIGQVGGLLLAVAHGRSCAVHKCCMANWRWEVGSGAAQAPPYGGNDGGWWWWLVRAGFGGFVSLCRVEEAVGVGEVGCRCLLLLAHFACHV